MGSIRCPLEHVSSNVLSQIFRLGNDDDANPALKRPVTIPKRGKHSLHLSSVLGALMNLAICAHILPETVDLAKFECVEPEAKTRLVWFCISGVTIEPPTSRVDGHGHGMNKVAHERPGKTEALHINEPVFMVHRANQPWLEQFCRFHTCGRQEGGSQPCRRGHGHREIHPAMAYRARFATRRLGTVRSLNSMIGGCSYAFRWPRRFAFMILS